MMSCVSLSASLWMGEREGVILHEGGGSGDGGRERGRGSYCMKVVVVGMEGGREGGGHTA